MSSDKKQERQIQQELETRIKEIRQHLSEQLKALDNRAETQRELITDYQEYFRQRSEIETQYAKDLEKLHDRTIRKQRQTQSQREKDLVGPQSPQQCWNIMLDMTKSHHRQHTTLSQVFSYNMANRFAVLKDELDNVYRKSREMMVEVHNEILRVLNELFAETKSYHTAHSTFKTTDEKQQQVQADLEKARKKGKRVKEHERQFEKGLQKLQAAQIKAARARNDYLLVTAAANATIQKYFGANVTELIDCLDLGYVRKTQKMMYAFQTSLNQMVRLQQEDLHRLELSIRAMNAGKDKEAFLGGYKGAFATPDTFQFYPHGGDHINFMVADIHPLSDEIKTKYSTMGDRIDKLETETNEIKKTLKEVEDGWIADHTNPNEEEVLASFNKLRSPESGADLGRVPSMRRGKNAQDTEFYYLGKFKEQLEKGNALARMQSRRDLMKQAVGSSDQSGHYRQNRQPNHMQHNGGKLKQRPGSVYVQLFGGELQRYLDSGNFQIPPVVESCIEFITVYGLHHHGIFRLPGSHLEINDMKDQYERGEDPIFGLGEHGDINVVASVLKAYFRELPEPLFPIDKFDHFMDAIKLPPGKDRIDKLSELIGQLPLSVMIIMRYLFAFLKNLSAYSDEHMMDSHNLALCFGPTLIRPPDGYDEVAYQGNINDLVDTMILFQQDIFPDKPGPHYSPDNGVDISPCESLDTIAESVMEDDRDNDAPLVATARVNYQGESPNELSYTMGDTLRLHERVDDRWWKGARGEQVGLIQQNHLNLPEGHHIEHAKSLPGSLAPPGTSSITSSPDHVRRHSDELRLLTVTEQGNPSAPSPDILRDVVRPFPPQHTYVNPAPSSTPTTPTGKKPPPVKPRPMRPKTALTGRHPSPAKSQTL